MKEEKKQKLDQCVHLSNLTYLPDVVHRVIERLTALGWGPELDEMKEGGYYQLSDHTAVRQLKRVTDKSEYSCRPRRLSG